MDILLVSDNDMCRTRIAEELLKSFGRGMKISTAALSEGSQVPEIVSRVMEHNGYEVSRKKPSPLAAYVKQPWDWVITLSDDAAREAGSLDLKTEHLEHFHYNDVFASAMAEEERESAIMDLYNRMYNELYEFYRDVLSDLLLPRCTCGANSYCRCE